MQLGINLKEGFTPLLTDNRGGNHRKISLLEETAFLKKYEEQALSGQIVTVKERRLDDCQTFNVSMTNQGFYLILQRHNWRKVKPRSVHPKVADADVPCLISFEMTETKTSESR